MPHGARAYSTNLGGPSEHHLRQPPEPCSVLCCPGFVKKNLRVIITGWVSLRYFQPITMCWVVYIREFSSGLPMEFYGNTPLVLQVVS